MGKNIAIVNYGAGNTASLRNAFEFLGKKAILAEKASQLREAEAVVFPGQGSFGQAMEYLEKSGNKEVLVEQILSGTPYLGICLGLQVLFESSEESPSAKGLGIFRGTNRRFSVEKKVPLIGWAKAEKENDSKLLDGIENGQYFYFVNSYFAVPENGAVVKGKSFYGEKFCSVVEGENVFATQFHPENSGMKGIKILRNFLDVVK